MKLLGIINGIKIYSPKSHTYYDQDLNFLPEYIRKKINHFEKRRQANKDVLIKEEPLSEHFRVYTTKNPQDNKFILKGEDFIAFEVSCQIAHLNFPRSKTLFPTFKH